MDARVLANVSASRECFELVERVGYEGILTDPGNIVYKAIQAFYRKDPDVPKVDLFNVKQRVVRKHAKHADLFEALFNQIGEVPASPANFKDELLEEKKLAAMNDIAEFAMAKNPGKLDNAIETYNNYNNEGLGDEGTQVLGSEDFGRILHSSDRTNRIRTLPDSLASSLEGGLVPQNHVVVFARPDMGKTTFTINLTRGFLEDDQRVLYMGNEDPAAEILKRVLASLLDVDYHVVLEHQEDAVEEARKKHNLDNLYFWDTPAGSVRELDTTITNIRPTVVVVDQLRNMSMHEDNRVLQLDGLARSVRQLGKRHNALMISVTQAGDSAQNKVKLEMNDVDFSNTGIPGACDYMIGIGATQEMKEAGRRVLSFPKKKGGDKVYELPVLFDVDKARVHDAL